MGIRFGDVFRSADGLATTAELRAAGVPWPRLRQWVSDGRVTPVAHGVYTPTEWRELIVDDPRRMHALAAGAVIRRNPGLVASHESAAFLHGIDLLLPPGATVPPVTLTRRPQDHSRSLRGGRVRVAALPDSDITTLFGVPVTSAPRAVMDIARTTGFTEGVVAADCALRTRLAIKVECAVVLEKWAGWPGSARARSVLGFSDPLAESALESLARVRIAEYGRRFGLDKPALQVNIRGPEGFIGRADFCWHEHRTIAEADGAGKYEDKKLARAQLSRDERFHDAGWGTVHFTWAEIYYEPRKTVERIWRTCRRQRELVPRYAKKPAR